MDVDHEDDGASDDVHFSEPCGVYQGRCNAFTDIKEANFMGGNKWVVSGSDDGNIFVWHKVCRKGWGAPCLLSLEQDASHLLSTRSFK